ncbi:MAG: mepS 1 [Mucilaginibacter sp.]|nr:mepS 1 [Mucilaginibacter sp.]
MLVCTYIYGMNKKLYLHCVLLGLAIVVSSCHSKKAILRGVPGEVVKPAGSVAEKYSALMGVDKNDIHNGRLYAFIDQWWGTPYKYGGQDKAGLDCSALAQLLEQEVYGINIPRTTSQQVTVIKRKYEEELQEGDLVFFDYDGGKFNHVGIYLQNGYLVHASSTKGVMIVRLHDSSMYPHFSRAGSIIADPQPVPPGK